MTVSDLKAENVLSRWTPDATTLGNRSLMGNGGSPFPVLANGYRDLRGLTISEIVKNITISDTDLSRCVTERFGQFSMCRVHRCSFHDASFTTNLGSEFQECDFTSAKLTGAVLRGKFVNCSFNSTDLSSVLGNQVQFIGCQFIKSNFRKATLANTLFDGCILSECRFGSGSLARSRFLHTPLESVDFGNTLMEKVIVE